MGTVARLEMSTRILHSPRYGPGVCADCFNLTRGFSKCFACAHLERHLSAVMPISYSVGGEYLHHVLADYKRARGPRAGAAETQLRAILSGFLARHEACIARAAGVAGFELVTTVPSSDRLRDEHHPLRRIVKTAPETHDRHQRLLRRTTEAVERRAFDRRRYEAVQPLNGENILLVDDMWTSGANAQSAAAALKAAGAATVAAVVIGRHLNRQWHENDEHLAALPFDWGRCAICAQRSEQGAVSLDRLPGPRRAESLERAA